MNLVLPIPDELAERLGASGDMARRALEAFGVAEYQAGRMTESELRRLLGFETRYELDGFLKEHGVFLVYTIEDLRREQETLDRLGVRSAPDVTLARSQVLGKEGQSNPAVHVITPEWLFERAGIAASGAVQWKQPVPEPGPGVYVVARGEVPDGGQAVVYIGRTKHLSRRLREFYTHKYGQSSPHRGGQAILKLNGPMTVHWAAVGEYAAAERTMMDAFKAVVGVWPFGNLMKSATMATSLI